MWPKMKQHSLIQKVFKVLLYGHCSSPFFSDCCHLCLPVLISPAVSRMTEASVVTAAGEAERSVWCFIYTLIKKHCSGELTFDWMPGAYQAALSHPFSAGQGGRNEIKKIMGQSKGSLIKQKQNLLVQKQRETVHLLSTSVNRWCESASQEVGFQYA